MVCCTLDAIKETTQIQVGNFIIIFFCLLFCDYAMRFIPMVIVKEVIFTCVTYAVTVCETDWKQKLAIRTDNSIIYDN